MRLQRCHCKVIKPVDLYDACLTFREDVPFFLEETRGAKGPVLELMCGTGRVSIPLLETRVPLTCADTSEEMLDVLRDKLRVRGFDGPVMTLDELAQSPGKFALIITSLGEFTRLTGSDAQSGALKLISEKLDKRGAAICTLDNRYFRTRDARGGKKLLGKYPLRGCEGKVVAAWTREKYDAQSRILTTDYDFEQYRLPSVLETVAEYRVEERMIEPQEFEEMARQSGLKVNAVYGNFRRMAFDARRSRVAVFVLTA